MKKLTIIIPCFNERPTIYELLRRVAAQDLSSLDLEKEIIVADDGSTDGSAEEVVRFQKDQPDVFIRLIGYTPNKGKGYAIQKALAELESDIVLVQDADLEYNPGDYPALLKPILLGMNDVVYGSRWLSPTMHVSGTLYTLGGFLENQYLHLLYRTNVTDIATGYKAMKTSLMKDLQLECDGFEFCPEVTAKLLNRRIQILEVPISYTPRKKAEGKKIKWQDFFIALYTITKIRFKRL